MLPVKIYITSKLKFSSVAKVGEGQKDIPTPQLYGWGGGPPAAPPVPTPKHRSQLSKSLLIRKQFKECFGDIYIFLIFLFLFFGFYGTFINKRFSYTLVFYQNFTLI